MDAVEEIKARLSIEDVVGRHVDLRRSGSSLKGLCPFHNEKTPSFYVSPARGTYHCFGCGKGGDIFSFVQEVERLDFPAALKELADQAGVTLPERGEKKPSLKNRLAEANAAAARFYRTMLLGNAGTRARAYLHERQFTMEDVAPFGLGYAPNGRDILIQQLRSDGFDDRTLLGAGLVYESEANVPPRDRFRSRLMFPIADSNGKIVGFGGRTLGDDQPKYLNSPQTEIFDKSSVLFGVHLAAPSIREAKAAVLVEGYLDAIRAHSRGFRNVVASLGTAVTVTQLTMLSRLTGTVVLALDPDPAGQSAAARTALTALAELTRVKGRQDGAAGALELRIATLPPQAGDPDELIRDDPDGWSAALSASVPAFDFFFTRTMAALDRSSDGWRQEAIDRLLPVIQQFGGSTGWQADWIERLARETGIQASVLSRSLPAGPVARPRGRGRQETLPNAVVSSTTTRGLTVDPVEVVERALLSLLLKLVVVPNAAADLLAAVRLKNGRYQELLDALLVWRANGNYDFELFCEDLDEQTITLANEIRAEDVPLPANDRLSAAVGYHLARIKLLTLREEQRRIRALLEEVDSEDRTGGVVALAEVLRQTNETERRIQQLSQAMVARVGDA